MDAYGVCGLSAVALLLGRPVLQFLTSAGARVVAGMISQAGFQLIRQLYLTNTSLSLIRLHSLPIKALYDQICLYRAGAHRDDLNNVSMIT